MFQHSTLPAQNAELLLQSFHSNRPKKKTEHSEEFIATNAIRNAFEVEVREGTLVEAEEADTNLQIKKRPDLFGVFFVFKEYKK